MNRAAGIAQSSTIMPRTNTLLPGQQPERSRALTHQKDMSGTVLHPETFDKVFARNRLRVKN